MNPFKHVSDSAEDGAAETERPVPADPIPPTPPRARAPVDTGETALLGMRVSAVIDLESRRSLDRRLNPIEQDLFWRRRFPREPYFEEGSEYADYAPAYRVGYESYPEHAGRSFDAMEPDLQARYDRDRSPSSLDWPRVRAAARAAWDRAARMTRI